MKVWLRIVCAVLCTALFLTGCVGKVPVLSDPTADSSTSQPDSTSNPGSDGPSKPEDPDTPSTPSNPSNPADPGDPDQPADPSDPSDPSDPVEPDGPVSTPDDGIVDIGVDPLPVSEDVLYTQLFDPNNKVTINLDMSASELQKIQDDYDYYRSFGSKSPIYRKGTLTVTITTSSGSTKYRISEVGVRMKGNTSRTDFYNANDGIYKYIHLKLDFQETFDDKEYYGSSAKVWASEEARDERKDRTFAALEQLEMRWNKCYDATYLRETYAYALYRSEGVIAPLSTLCSFDWSNTHMGIYTIVEPVDKAFLEKRFSGSDADGDLYKCGWVTQPASFTNTNSIGIEDEDNGKFYSYDLKNNKKTSTHAALKNLINRLNSPTLTKEELAQLVDMNSFLSYAAVSYFLGNPDDLRNNYNNFYIYFVPSTGKAIIIPYDYDRCFGLTYEWDPTGNGVTQDDPFGESIAAQDNNGGQGQKNPLYLKTLVKGGFYVEEYANILKRVASNSMLQSSTFESWFNRAKNLYGNDVRPSKTLRNADGRNFSFSLSDGIAGNLSISNYLSKKMATYNRYMANLDDILDYVRPEQVIYYLRGDFNNWSDQQRYGMTIKDGKATITVNFTKTVKFKVYNQAQQLWFNEVSDDTTVAYNYVGGNQNISVGAGRYTIVLDLETQLITITAA